MIIKTMRQAIAIAALVTGTVIAGYWGIAWRTSDSKVPAMVQVPATDQSAEARRVETLRRVRNHLDWADAQCQRSVEASLGRLRSFFSEAEDRTSDFAGTALSFSSKWRLAVDYLPLTRGDRSSEYLREQFNEVVFSPEDLKQMIDGVVKEHLRELTDIENQMLVRVRLDVAGLSDATLGATADDEQLRTAFQNALESVRDRVARELGADAAQFMVIEAANQIATRIGFVVLEQVAVRLGVSGGILAAGAGNSWWSLGATAVVGVIVDWIVSRIWDWWSDPVGQLSESVNASLDELCDAIIEGSAGENGLRAALEQVNSSRAKLRAAAMAEVFRYGEE